LDDRISEIGRAVERGNYLEAVGLFLAIIAEIVDTAEGGQCSQGTGLGYSRL